jgi:hypothetical protein
MPAHLRAAWTTSIDVARSYAAEGFCRACDGGSVLLEALAPADAIVCAPIIVMASRRLSLSRDDSAGVTVVERFEQRSLISP